MFLTWSDRLDATDEIVAVVNGNFNFKKLDGYVQFTLLYGMQRMSLAQKRGDVSSELVELYNWYLSTLLKFIDVPVFDYTAESYAVQSDLYSRVPDLSRLSGISVSYIRQTVEAVTTPSLVLLSLVAEDIKECTELYQTAISAGVPIEQCAVVHEVTDTMHKLNLSRSLSADAVSACQGNHPCKSVYGCHVDIVHALSQLIQSFIYFNNSQSMRTGVYESYDRFEIERRNELVGLLVKHIQKI